MAARERIGLAVIGLGRIGQVHARNIKQYGHQSQLIAVSDVDERRASELGNELGCFAGTVSDVLGRDDVHGVVIATPLATHSALIKLAVAARKHVLCEKPLAATAQEALEVANSLPDDMVVQVGFQRRFDPDYVDAVRRVHAGELGDIYLLRTSMRDMAPPSEEIVRAQQGFVLEATGHDFDAVRWIAGEVDEVAAFGAALSSPLFSSLGDHDNLVVVVRFTSGALGVIDNSRVAGYGFECSTEIMASGGTVRVGNHRRQHVTVLRDGREQFDRVTDFLERFEFAYRLEIEGFCSAIIGGERPRVSVDDGIAALLLSEAAQQALTTASSVSMRDDPRYTSYLS